MNDYDYGYNCDYTSDILPTFRSDGAHLNHDMTILSLISFCRCRLFDFPIVWATIGSIGSRSSRRLGLITVTILGLSGVGGWI